MGFKKAIYFSHINRQFKTLWRLLIYLGIRMLLDFLCSITGKWLPSSWSSTGDQQSFHFFKKYCIIEERLWKELHVVFQYLLSLSK